MLKVLALAVIWGLCDGAVKSIKFPQNNPCLLVDIDADFSMVWTDANGTPQTVPDFTLADASTLSGSCSPDTPIPEVILGWSDGGTFTFMFTNNDDVVQYGWNMKYSPMSVYKNNTQAAAVTHTGSLGTGSDTTAYACQNVPAVDDTKTGTDSSKYQLKITINSIKAQAFNVADGAFSQEGRCPADQDTTAAAETTQPPTQPTTQPPKETTQPPKETTEPPKETTEPPKDTTAPPPETTPAGETTAPPSETTAPTTEPTPGNDTTAPPTGTTPPVTTPPSTQPTTAPPAPGAHAKQTFEVFDEGVQCVLMMGEFLFTLAYPKKDKTMGSENIGVQEIKSVTGTCNETAGENQVSVEFYDTWVMDLTIAKKGSSAMLAADGDTEYYWSRLNLKYDLSSQLGGKPLFPDADTTNGTAKQLNVSLPEGTYQASSGGSYLCNSNENVDLQGGNSLQTWNLQYDAFNTGNHTTFSDKNLSECSADSKTSSVVPIAVGAALAGLVVIVLIAYLIGRRRNRKGYESV